MTSRSSIAGKHCESGDVSLEDAQIAAAVPSDILVAKDVFHDAVRHALEKEQWTITEDPLFLRFGEVDMYIDLAAEQLISAEKIAVEIKSFIGVSATTEFSTALGQFLKYQFALEEEQPDRILHLAIPLDAERRYGSRYRQRTHR